MFTPLSQGAHVPVRGGHAVHCSDWTYEVGQNREWQRSDENVSTRINMNLVRVLKVQIVTEWSDFT